MRRNLIAFALAAASIAPAAAQTTMTTPAYTYYGGVLAADTFEVGAFNVPAAKQMDLERFDYGVTLGAGARYDHQNRIIDCNGGAGSNCYGDVTVMINDGPGLTTAQYLRMNSRSSGYSIARKTAVRYAMPQWGNWMEQVALGPNTQTAWWVSSDNPTAAEGYKHTAENVMVVSALGVSNALIQWNRCPTCQADGVFLRVYGPDNTLKFQVDANGNVYAKSFNVIP